MSNEPPGATGHHSPAPSGGRPAPPAGHQSPAPSGGQPAAPAGYQSPAPQGRQPAAPDWAPDACTLPSAERPLRGAEFRAAFADLVRRAERPEPTRLRLDLARTPQAAGRIAELAARETECCSFFTFTLGVTGSALTLDITVPPAHVPVLDALAAHA